MLSSSAFLIFSLMVIPNRIPILISNDNNAPEIQADGISYIVVLTPLKREKEN